MEKLQEKLKHKDLTSTNLKNFIKMRHPIKKKGTYFTQKHKSFL